VVHQLAPVKVTLAAVKCFRLTVLNYVTHCAYIYSRMLRDTRIKSNIILYIKHEDLSSIFTELVFVIL